MNKKKQNYSVLKDITILVVEDNESELEELSELLDIYFAKCFKAINGEEGIKQYEKYHPDIILTDLGMAGMDGFEMTEKIREIDKDVSIVLHTIFTNVDIFLKAIKCKISGYVVKPTNARLLLDTLLKESQNILKEKELKKEKILIKTVSNEFPDPMMVIDLDYNVLFANNLVKNSRHWHSAPIKCHQAFYGSDYPCEFSGQMCGNASAFKNKSNVTHMHEGIDSDGNKIYFSIKTIPLRDEKKNIYAFLKIIQDKTADKAKEIKLEYLANYDALTNLPNRVLLFDRLEQAILRSNRSKINFALLFIDLDKFKTINDTFGHDIGDKLLQAVSSRMKLVIRKIDTVSRFGGDEFIIILESVTDKKQVEIVVQDILDKVKLEFKLSQNIKAHITCSIGIEVYSPTTFKKSKKQLIQDTDKAMYEAKKSGKGTFKFFEEIEHNG